MTGDQERRVASALRKAVVLAEAGEPDWKVRDAVLDGRAALTAADAVSSPDTDRCVCEPGGPDDEPHDPRCPLSRHRSSSVPSRGEEQPIWQPRCFNCDVTRAEKRATQARVEALEAALRERVEQATREGWPMAQDWLDWANALSAPPGQETTG